MSMQKRVVIGVLVVVAVLGAFGLREARKRDQSAANVANSAAPAPIGAQAKLPRLVDLGANKCKACKAMKPILEALTTDFAGRLNVEFIDVWENEGAGEDYGIQMIPTQIFFSPEGKELWRHEGFLSREDILERWAELGFSLQSSSKAGATRAAESL